MYVFKKYRFLLKNTGLWASKYRFVFPEVGMSVLEVSDYILKNMDAGRFVGAVFLDLKKALDTVCHPILINKLQSFGVGGLELDWFTSYLSNKTNC